MIKIKWIIAFSSLSIISIILAFIFHEIMATTLGLFIAAIPVTLGFFLFLNSLLSTQRKEIDGQEK